MSHMRRPSGEQWTIRDGVDEVVVAQVGGGLRSWTRAGERVLAGYGQDEMCTSGRGQQLIPWPNRIRDGRWSFAGTEHQLPLTEVEFHNASHGLLRWVPWRLATRDEGSLTVTARLHPQPGWSWILDCETTYAIAPTGLAVLHVVTNLSPEPAPLGVGIHPYIATGGVALKQVELTVPAGRCVTVDARMLPVDLVPVGESGVDFRDPRRIGGQRLDTAFTDLRADEDGVWRVRVHAPGRTPWTVWGELSAFPWVQVFTGKAEEGQAGEHGIAVEPMSCPADAFNSGTDLVILEPGASWVGRWGISPA